MTAPAFGDTEIHGDQAQIAIGNQVSRDLIQQSYTFVRGHPAMYLGSDEIMDRLRCHVPASNHDPMRYKPAWRAVLNVLAVADVAIEGVVRRWLDAALH